MAKKPRALPTAKVSAARQRELAAEAGLIDGEAKGGSVRFVDGPYAGKLVERWDAGRSLIQVTIPGTFDVANYALAGVVGGVAEYRLIGQAPEREARVPGERDRSPLDLVRHVTPWQIEQASVVEVEIERGRLLKLVAANLVATPGRCGDCGREAQRTIAVYWDEDERWCSDCIRDACEYGGTFDRLGTKADPWRGWPKLRT